MNHENLPVRGNLRGQLVPVVRPGHDRSLVNSTTSKERYEAAVKEYWEWHHRLSVADGNGSSPALVSKLQKELCDAQERRNLAFKEYVEDTMEEQ